MESKKFIEETIMTLDDELFEECRDKIVEDYVHFSIIEVEDITKPILAEKLCDYFSKVYASTGKYFDKLIKEYASNFEYIVECRVAKPIKKKNEPTVVPRAREYYNQASWVKKEKLLSLWGLREYSRIMMCLYMAIIKKHLEIVHDMDFSAQCIDIDSILKFMESKDKRGKKVRESSRIIAIIMYYHMKSKEVVGEY